FAGLEVIGAEDVAVLAVAILQRSDTRRALGVVLDGRDPRRHAVLVALEVDHAVEPLLAAAAVACRDLALHVATGLATLGLHQALLRPLLAQPGEVWALTETHARGGGLEFLQRHQTPSTKKRSIFCPSARRTMALRRSGRLPIFRPTRRILPGTFITRTCSTFTLKASSTASFT